MQRLIATLSVSLLLVVPSLTQADDDPMHQLGLQMCALGLEGKVEGIDAAFYRKAVANGGSSDSQYCGCVAEVFMINSGAQAPRMAAAKTPEASVKVLLDITAENMGACLPSNAEDEGDVSELDAADVEMCEQLAQGAALAPGFDTEAIARRMISVGGDVAQLCGCAAANMVGTSETIEQQGAANGDYSRIWLQMLAQRMDDCASNM